MTTDGSASWTLELGNFSWVDSFIGSHDYEFTATIPGTTASLLIDIQIIVSCPSVPIDYALTGGSAQTYAFLFDTGQPAGTTNTFSLEQYTLSPPEHLCPSYTVTSSITDNVLGVTVNT